MAELKASGYQLVPLTKLLRNGRNAVLICDGVGVGKTISAAYILKYLMAAYGRPSLVICPPALVDKWYLELKTKFQTIAVPIRSGEELGLTTDYWDLPTQNPRVFLLPSSLLSGTKGAQFSGPVVIDEIHNYRNPSTQMWKAAKSVTGAASHRIGLSATPINNALSDLAAEFSILLNLNIHVCEAIVQDGWRPGRNSMFYPIMTRFTKDRLGIHFARRQVHDVAVSITEEYRQAVMTAVKQLRARPESDAIYRDEITYFRLAASSANAFKRSTGIHINAIFDKMNFYYDVLSKHLTEKIIVFCEFEETAKELVENVKDRPAYLITGSVPVFSRENILEQFRNSDAAILVMTSVGAEGIDLQFCSTLINYDLTWNPMVLEQRIGRIDRIGQMKSSIAIYNVVVKGSIDERIIKTLGRKLGLVEGSVLESGTVIAGIESDPTEMFTRPDFNEELRKATALAEAVSLTSAIIPQDYDLLPAIDTGFCSALALSSAARNPSELEWLRHNEASTLWQNTLIEDRRKFDELVERYAT